MLQIAWVTGCVHTWSIWDDQIAVADQSSFEGRLDNLGNLSRVDRSHCGVFKYAIATTCCLISDL